MKRILILTIFLICIFQISNKLYALDLIVENKNFWSPQSGDYVETGLMILGSSLKTDTNKLGDLTVAVDILITFKNESGIVAFDKYRLNKKNIKTSEIYDLALIDKKRFVLKAGVYEFQALVKDANNPMDSFQIKNMHVVSTGTKSPSFSDIQLLESYEKSSDLESDFVKNGMFMLPQVINHFPTEKHKLTFYLELYHSEKYLKVPQLLISYSIRKQSDKKLVNNLIGYKKVEASEVIPFLAEIDIEKLETGNYILKVEAKNTENKLLCENELTFQKENNNSSKELENIIAEKEFVEGFDLPSISYQLKSFVPIANAMEAKEINTLLNKGELPALKSFFKRFWTARNPDDPYGTWYAYTEKVKGVNNEYNTNLLYGFQTDRGRVYLQYGAPNQVLEAVRQAGSNPYEIWHYYGSIGKQNNVKFVFLNKDLVGNNYELVHSDALGEVKNEQWKTLAQSKGMNSPTENQKNSDGFFGNQINDFSDQ